MIKTLLDAEGDEAGPEPVAPKPKGSKLSLFDENKEDEPFVLSEAAKESPDETLRRSGLAWSAGVAMFSSIVFMLVLGWLCDLLLGSSPWGIVVGIAVGSLIGFIQLFRISSQIFKK